MADTVLTLKQIEDFFQELTCNILGIPLLDNTDPENPVPINQDKVRIAWPTTGAPAWKITEDITFLQITPVNDPYMQQRHTEHVNTGAGNINQLIQYTRVHEVQWICYGPNSYEHAETIRNGIYLTEFKDLLGAQNLHLILDVPAVKRSPELYNGQWWQRANLSARFNELVIRTTSVPYLVGTDIKVITEKGVVN